MKIVVGIGNPGPEYDRTRHNVGFETLDAVAEQTHIEPTYRRRFSALVASCMIGEERVLLVKPQIYVNLSGDAVCAALDWHDESVDNLFVVCDDLNLDLGRIRVRRKGSSGGHNGLKSIADVLDTEDYARLRIGIGQPRAGQAADFVLSRFSADERIDVDRAIALAGEAVRCWITQGIEPCMNEFNAV